MRPTLLSVLATLALCPAAAAQHPPCDEDLVYASVVEATIRLGHDAAHYNCCSDFTYAVESVAGGMLVTETEIQFIPCDCECCFDLGVSIENAPAGEYSLTLRWFEYETRAWREYSLPVVVSDSGQSGDSTANEPARDGCDSTPGAAPSWGALKSAYR